MADGLWTVPPGGRPQAVHQAWTTLRVAHTAHSPDDDEVALFSMIKWPYFRLSKFRRGAQSGPLFGKQMALFSVDKNRWYFLPVWAESGMIAPVV